MRKKIKIVAIIFLIVSFIGFLDAAYLTVEHYRGTIPPCTIAGCEVVLKSEQSEIFGIPVALLGSLYYLTLLTLSVATLNKEKETIIKFTAKLTPIGFLASLYFVYLQLFVIKAICQYCMVSAFTSTLLFIIGLYIYIIFKNHKAE